MWCVVFEWLRSYVGGGAVAVSAGAVGAASDAATPAGCAGSVDPMSALCDVIT